MSLPFAGIAAVAGTTNFQRSTRPGRGYHPWIFRLFFCMLAIFLLQISYRLLFNLGPPAVTSTLKVPATMTVSSTTPDIKVHGTMLQSRVNLQNPCVGRPTPQPISRLSSSPPALFFLHIPKTAGTLMYSLVKQYANRTNGLACQFLFDGNRYGPSEYQMSILPPPIFQEGSIERLAVDAYNSMNRSLKSGLYERGACRSIRGHVTYSLRDALHVPTISLTVVRDPLERFVSMYEFVLSMVNSRPGETGWDRWLAGTPLAEEFGNSSSIVNHGFYDDNGSWIAKNNIGFSFHFYGVLHQLSGITPKFKGVKNPFLFELSNAAEMAEVAKDNLCSSHILGSQSDVEGTLKLFFETMQPFANWTNEERKQLASHKVNRNSQRKSRNIDDHLPPLIRSELERRLRHEIDVVRFAERIVSYRNAMS